MIWQNIYEDNLVPIFEGKKQHNIKNLIPALAIIGPSTTFEIARFILSHSSEREYPKVRATDVRSLAISYSRLITGREYKKKGKKKIKKLPGLIETGFVKQVGTKINSKEIEVPIYFLTLVGCFLALGSISKDSEIKKFIFNCAKNHLFFAYLKSILEVTSIKFVREIFIDPLQIAIAKEFFNLSRDFTFYFANIAEIIGRQLFAYYRSLLETFRYDLKDDSDYLQNKNVQNMEKLIDNTFYYERTTDDWEDAIAEKYYKGQKDRDFYIEYSDYSLEHKLLYKVMREIHFAYFMADPIISNVVPRSSRIRLRRSRSWQRHLKWKNNPELTWKDIQHKRRNSKN